MAKDRLTAKQEQCIDLLIKNYKNTGREMTIEQIAVAIGKTRQTVSNWMNHNELFRAEYDRRVRELNKYSTAYAMQTIVELLASPHAPTRLGAAKDILDRAGFKPADVVEVNGVEPVVIIDDMGG